MRLAHCLDFIRQSVMCNMDISMAGTVWVNQTNPFIPDFHRKHVCVNFDDIRAWAERNQVPKHIPDDYIQLPEGVVMISESAP